MRRYAFILCITIGAVRCHAQNGKPADTAIEQARMRWEQSPHGAMLARILPPVIAPEQLPQADSAGAQLLARYCVQCHNLPNPAMHHAAKWPGVVERTPVVAREPT